MKYQSEIHHPVLLKQIKDNWLLWFENCNNYAVLTSAQKAALDLYYSVNGDTKQFFRLLHEEANWGPVEIDEALDSIQILFQDLSVPPEPPPAAPFVACSTTRCPLYREFRLGQRHIRVESQDDQALSLLWPTLAHLASEPVAAPDIVFRLLRNSGNLYLYKDETLLQSVAERDYHYITGKFLMHIITELHEVQETGWIGTLHASTVVRNEQALMLAGRSGQGKSTLSTLLCSAGYQLLADDITPLRANTLELARNPSAVSVKAGAFNVIRQYFPELDEIPEIHLNAFKGNVKYLPLSVPSKAVYPCRHLVLVRYEPGAEARLQPVAPAKILEAMVPDSWIAPQPAHARAFMDWLNSLHYYQITYSRLEEAVLLLNKLTPAL